MKRINYTIIIGLVLLCLPFFMSYGQGARYTGSYTKSSAISYTGRSNIVIEGLDISNVNGDAISLQNCENVIIRNNRISSTTKRGIYLYNCKNVTIIDNTFENVQSGLVASRSQGIKFDYNDVTNVVGKLRGSNAMGVMAQLVEVTGAGNSVSFNANENFSGQSAPEDLINIYNSHGTAQSPIVVRGNWIRGGGPSTSGGGINLGDMSGSYQIAEDNILVNPGQYGVAISGGHNMTLRNNKVFASRQSFNNVGLIAVNWYEDISPSHNITVSNNLINYTNKDGSQNSWWMYTNVEPIAGKATNRFDSSINSSILPTQIIGRARAGLPNNPGPGNGGPGNGGSDGGSTPLPGDDNGSDQGGTPGDNGNQPNPGDGGNGPEIPGLQLPDVNNHPAISIYLDRYNRVCVNIIGRNISANVLAANSKGELIYNATLNRFHNVLPNRPSPGNYVIYVRDGNREHLQTLYIP